MTEEEIRKQAQEYVSREQTDAFAAEVKDLLDAGNFEELADRFYRDLEFGTGGLRGVIGGGYNRMNTYVVRRATEGLARYLERHGTRRDGELRAVIAHDSRRYSREFALETALVLCRHGVKTFLFSSLRPTPELSFAVRQLGGSTGIVVTASHNPPEYNGYKVYWDDGSQVISPHDKGIIDEVNSVEGSVEAMDREAAESAGLLQFVDEDVDKAFVETVVGLAVRPDLLRSGGKDLKLVYTPLHGTGAYIVERVLSEVGISCTSVPEQREPDGEFPTVESPNPEEPSAMRMATELGKRVEADLVVGTDPDADRIGTAFPRNGEMVLVTGNQLGVLLVDYVFSSLKELNRLPPRPAFVKTIVTTELQRLVAEHHGAEVYDTLTGFKYIAAKIREFEAASDGPTYVMGDEESYGYMIGDHVRDKDSVSATLLTAELTLYHRSKGKTVLERLEELYRQFGYFEEIQISRYFKGQKGSSIMQGLMDSLRASPPKEISGRKVVTMQDYLRGESYNPATGEKTGAIEQPSSNVLQFVFADGVLSVRPSGTEPKIKFYASLHGEAGEDLEPAKQRVKQGLADLETEVDGIIERAGGA